MYGISKYLHSLPLFLHLFFECNLLIFTLPSLPPPLLLSLPSPFLSPSLPSSLFPLPSPSPSLPLPSLLPFFSPLFPSSFSLSLSLSPFVQDVFEHPVAMLVGAGIGVTPFASVLKSLYYRITEEGSGLVLKKLYFVWICPETYAFEWFANLFQELEQQLHDKGIDDFLTSWIYLTRGWKDNQVSFLFCSIILIVE